MEKKLSTQIEKEIDWLKNEVEKGQQILGDTQQRLLHILDPICQFR